MSIDPGLIPANVGSFGPPSGMQTSDTPTEILAPVLSKDSDEAALFEWWQGATAPMPVIPPVQTTPTKDERPTWDAYFLAGAEWVATRADCTRSKVGAILVNADKEVRGTGYNGAPSGVPGCLTSGACPRGQMSANECAPNSDYANCTSDHAERNAIEHTKAEERLGATLYTTREPCPRCWTLILASGIYRVVTPTTRYRRDA
ncbi:deoxycytidylate deaminase [Streptomyces sp. NPDC050421]|uniref:deoxycytidylate deaminase n=1 Tax=Streptomyces sp. NPDC050421 TaxID=3365613 RepID=UPI00379881A0